LGAMSEAPAYPGLFADLPDLHGAGTKLGVFDVHVWRAHLDLPRERLTELDRTLSAGERDRYRALRSERDRARATASRGLVRRVLAEYTGIPAADLGITYGPAGKPELHVPEAERSEQSRALRFNVAHSSDMLLIAVGRVPILGVDVERIRSVARWEKVARRAFSSEERSRIESLPAELRNAAFLTCWTRKEACVKAIGEGVWSAFGRFEVSVEPGLPAGVLSVDGDPVAAAEWSLYHLEPAPGFVGALAVSGSASRMLAGTLHHPEAQK
jgi:4'-phosphopantetheinyl transferase